MARDRFVRVASADNQFQAEEYVAVLERTGITVLLQPRGQQASDPLTSATSMPWWEILVPEADAQRAVELVQGVARDAELTSGAAQEAALEEYQREPVASGEAGSQRGESPARPRADTSSEAGEAQADLRPESVRLAGFLHFGLFGITLFFALVPRLEPRAFPGGSSPAMLLSDVFGLFIGYALAWGRETGRFWRRVRLLALLRLFIGVLIGLAAFRSSGPVALMVVLAQLAIVAALAGELGPAGRKAMAVVFAGCLFGTVGLTSFSLWPANARSLDAAERTVAMEWWNTETYSSLSLCPDRTFVEKRPAGEPITGTWTATGNASAGTLALRYDSGASVKLDYRVLDEERFCSPSGCDVTFNGTRHGRDPKMSLCRTMRQSTAVDPPR